VRISEMRSEDRTAEVKSVREYFESVAPYWQEITDIMTCTP